MHLPPLHNVSLTAPTPAPTSVEPDAADAADAADRPVAYEDLEDDVVANIFEMHVKDGDITELCKKASEWCLGMGMGRAVCMNGNDPQWERLCERVGWPKAATATPRRTPPTVGDEQFTWKKTFFSMCKALNNVNGTFPEAYGPDSRDMPNHQRGRSWYRRMVKEQGKPQADQNQVLLERAVFEWSINSGAHGHENPPPVMIACSLAHGPYSWQTSPWEVNAVRARYKAADKLLFRSVLQTDYDAFDAALGAGADVDMRGRASDLHWDGDAPREYREPYPMLVHAILNLRELGDDADEEDHARRETAWRIMERLVREGADINAQPEALDLSYSGPASAALYHKAFDAVEFLMGRPDFHPDPMEGLVEKAADANATDVVRALLQHPNVVVEDDDTALLNAVRRRNVEMVRLLAEDGRLDLNTRDTYDDMDALTIAAKTGQTEVMTILREAGATELGLVGFQQLWVAELFRGITEGREKASMASLARYVLGDRVNRRMDSEGNTVLIRAVERAYIEVVRALLAQEGIRVAARNHKGKTALNTAEASAAFVSQESRRQEWPEPGMQRLVFDAPRKHFYGTLADYEEIAEMLRAAYAEPLNAALAKLKT